MIELFHQMDHWVNQLKEGNEEAPTHLMTHWERVKQHLQTQAPPSLPSPLWAVFRIGKKQVGTKQVHTKEYERYLDELYQYEQTYGDDAFGFFSGPPTEPKEKYTSVPYEVTAPLLVGVFNEYPYTQFKKEFDRFEYWAWEIHLNKLNILSVEKPSIPLQSQVRVLTPHCLLDANKKIDLTQSYEVSKLLEDGTLGLAPWTGEHHMGSASGYYAWVVRPADVEPWE